MATINPADLAAQYGVVETGGLTDPSYHDGVDHSDPVTLGELARRGGKVTRLRMLTEPGYPYIDISYAHGTLPDGRIVPIVVTCGSLPRQNKKAALVAWARREGVYAKGLGLLDEANWSVLY